MRVAKNNPLSLHKYLYTEGNPVNNIDPSGELTVLEINLVMDEEFIEKTSDASAKYAFQQRATTTLIFKIGAWAVIGTAIAGNVALLGTSVQDTEQPPTSIETIYASVQTEAISSTDERAVNTAIQEQIDQARRRRIKLRFFHYTPRTHAELSGGLWPNQFAALRGNMYYYEARNLLGVGDPTYVYPVDIDPTQTRVVPRGLVPSGGYGGGGEPQVEFPDGTPPGSVQPGIKTKK